MVSLVGDIQPKEDGVVEELLVKPLRGTEEEAEMLKVHWMSGKPVRHFDIPERGKVPEQEFLEFMLDLVQDFQTRFVRMADGADEVRFDSQDTLDQYQAEYETAVQMEDPQWQVTSKAQLETAKYLYGMDAAQKHIEMRTPNRRTSTAQILDIIGEEGAREVVETSIPDLIKDSAQDKDALVDKIYEVIVNPSAVATTKRGLRDILTQESSDALNQMADELGIEDSRDAVFEVVRNIRDSIKSHLKEEALGVLQKRAEKGINDVASAITNGEIRMKGGTPDIDEVLNEAKGEPLNAFMGTMGPGGEGYMRKIFYENRFRKVTQAWDEKDKIVDAMQKIVENTPFAEVDKERLKAATKELGDAMEARSETLRGQDGFARASSLLRARRDEFNQFDPSENLGRAGSLMRPQVDRAVDILREGMKLIYDMAHIRGAKPKSTETYLDKAKSITDLNAGKTVKYADPELRAGNDGQTP